MGLSSGADAQGMPLARPIDAFSPGASPDILHALHGIACAVLSRGICPSSTCAHESNPGREKTRCRIPYRQWPRFELTRPCAGPKGNCISAVKCAIMVLSHTSLWTTPGGWSVIPAPQPSASIESLSIVRFSGYFLARLLAYIVVGCAGWRPASFLAGVVKLLARRGGSHPHQFRLAINTD